MKTKLNFSLDEDVKKIPSLVMVVGEIGSCRNIYGKDLVKKSRKPAAWVSAADKFLNIRNKRDLPKAVKNRLLEFISLAKENNGIIVFSWQIEIIPNEEGEIKLENLRLGRNAELVDYILWPQRTEEGYEVKILKEMEMK